MESVSGLCQTGGLIVAGGGNRQVKLRAGSNVLIVKQLNSYIPGDKTLCQNALHTFGRFNLCC